MHPPLHHQLSCPFLFRRWKSYNDRYDPSCPWRGRSCANVPWRYWKACCAGKKAVGLKDGACRPAPVGSTCASRGPANLDACESNHRHLVLWCCVPHSSVHIVLHLTARSSDIWHCDIWRSS